MSPCTDCHAGCCRSFAIPTTGADIIRIETDLKLDFWSFVCRWADPEGQIARKYAPHFRFPDEPETPFVICLTHAPSEFHPGTTKCRFLIEGQPDAAHPLGQARCGAYRARPLACRAFPTKMNATGELVVIHEVPERVRTQPSQVYDLCPRQWEQSDIDAIQTPQDLAVARYEMNFFHQLASLWNKSPLAWTQFPDFLRIVYESRVQREVVEEPITIKFPTPQREAGKRAA